MIWTYCACIIAHTKSYKKDFYFVTERIFKSACSYTAITRTSTPISSQYFLNFSVPNSFLKMAESLFPVSAFSLFKISVDSCLPICGQRLAAHADFADCFAQNLIVQRSSFLIAVVIGRPLRCDAKALRLCRRIDIGAENCSACSGLTSTSTGSWSTSAGPGIIPAKAAATSEPPKAPVLDALSISPPPSLQY